MSAIPPRADPRAEDVVVLYGRHSSDLQNPRSTFDQLTALRVVAEARGYTVVGEFADEAVSGSTLLRPGLRDLLARAGRGEFNRVLAEALDRISRDQEGVAHVFKRLAFAGVTLETLSEGVVSELHVGLTGTMNQLFLKELANKTRRGLIARVRSGYSGGGRCYGYDLVDTGSHGERGVLRVNEEEAAVVRRIFSAFVGGASPRRIAETLNNEGVAGPRHGAWCASSIRGDRRTQDGVICQELYVGVRLFNRRRYRRHPDSDRRSSVVNPAHLWVRAEVPHLRLLDDGLWRAAQARSAAIALAPGRLTARPKRLLSRLMTCGLCGSSMILNGGRYVCRRASETRTCDNRRTIAAGRVEARLVTPLRQVLLSPAALDLALEAARTADPVARHDRREQAKLRRRLAILDQQRRRVLNLCIAGLIDTDEVKTRQSAWSAERDRLQVALEELEGDRTSSVLSAETVKETYTVIVAQIPSSLEAADAEPVRRALRTLLGEVVFHPLAERGGFALKVKGLSGWV